MNTSRLERLQEMRKADPNDPFLIYAMAMEYHNGNEYLKALEFYKELLEKHENYVGTYYHVSKLYEAMDDKLSAEKSYTKGMEVAKKLGDHHAYNELQSAYRSFQGIGEDDEY